MGHRSRTYSAVMASTAFIALATFTHLNNAYGSQAKSPAVSQIKPSGLTSWGIANARQNSASSALVKLAPQGNMALLKQARNLGPRSPSSTMRLTIGLKLRNIQELKQFLSEVQNPGSPQYHQFLTPSQFTDLYGPTQAQVNAVKKYLEQSNLTVEGVSSNHTLIHVKGTTSAFEHAFMVSINNYELNGRTFLSTQDRVQIPRALSGIVLNVLGLNRAQVMRPYSHYKALSELGVRSSSAGSNLQVSPPPATASSAYFDPSQIATAYDWPSITNQSNGAGVSVAIITADSSGLASDPSPSEFWQAFGLPDHTINVIPVDGDQGLTDGMTETLLDVEWSGAMAPGITQNVYDASSPSLTAFTDAYNQFVTDDTSQVMTTSWGAPEFAYGSLAQITDQIFMQGAAEGISMFAAAGDSGTTGYNSSDGSVSNNADFPSSSPYVTAANGTVLTISNVSGTYGSETAWYDTGGAISQVFTQPLWQTGSGVPAEGMRMNSDMSLNSGDNGGSDYLLYDSQQGFGAVFGTSAVAPQLAALFAIGVSQNGGVSLGQSSSLIYEDADGGNYSTDFHDITSGCNGVLPDGSPSCATTGWDHPTGWGSPVATSLLSHLGATSPSGTLNGTVTNANGQPVAGAGISVDGSYEGPTASDGSYSFIVPAGTHSVAAVAFGYKNSTTSASVTANNTTTQNFTLNAAPTATISGDITDGSGHGYGLYAEITVKVTNTPSGYGAPKNLQVADVWTDPKTGAYSVKLPQGYGYAMNVVAAFDGYQTASKAVTLSGNTNANFPLAVSGTCSAPGYQFISGGFGEDFNSPTFPPAGWTVADPASTPVIWELSNAPGNYGNQTGGTGTAAEANSFLSFNPSNNPPLSAFDTSLITPPISATSLQGTPILRYKAFYGGLSTMPLDLDITTDGGSSWTNILHWTSPHPTGAAQGEDENINLSPYLPSSGNFQLRWHFYGPASYSSTFAQVDDVVIGSCQPVSGGLIMGQVTDANTGDPILDAHIADGNGTDTNAVENYADPNLPVGFYEFFDTSGQLTLTASAPSNYSSGTAGITLNNNSVVVQDFALKAAKIGAAPGQFTLNVMVNSSATASFALSNTGGSAAQYQVLGIDGPAPATQQSPMPAMGRGTALIRMPVANPSWVKASMLWVVDQLGSSGSRPSPSGTSSVAAPGAGTSSMWQAITPYPKWVSDNTAARDPATGKIYSMGGTYADMNPYDFNYREVLGIDNTAYVYDPKNNSWSSIANAPVAREAAVSAFINGKYYVVNGWAAGAAANPVAEMDIYNPATGQWSTGAPNPIPAAGGSASAVLNGAFYVVGGCMNGACTVPTNAVQVYHPDSDSWTSAANYPQAITFASCGAISGKLYCAGGMHTSGAIGNAYVYDPSTNSWSPIAPMFVPLGQSFYSAANGLLLVAGGVDGGLNVVNESEAYDPQTNSWMPLPNLPGTDSRGGYACGFYQIGGITGYSPYIGAITTGPSRVLPGYTQQCGTVPTASWLTASPASGTLQVGAAAKIELVVDGSGQKPYTSSKAYVSVSNKSPYGPVIVPLTINWEPQPVALMVSGSVDPASASVSKGTNVTYDFTVTNKVINGDGTATQTMLTVTLPANMSFVQEQGSSCSASAGVIACPIGDLAPGAKASVIVVAQVSSAGKDQVEATATALEPQDSSVNNTTTLPSNAKSSSSSGGGSFDWPVLVLLFGLVAVLGRRRAISRLAS